LVDQILGGEAMSEATRGPPVQTEPHPTSPLKVRVFKNLILQDN